jgi:uncharacterized membrane protein YkoI
MTEKIKGVAAAMAAVAALAVGGAAIAGAAGNGNSSSSPQQPTASHSSEPAGSQEGNEGPDQAITGSALDQASAAALAHTGGGQVTDTEVGDEQSYYEVEVTRDDGSQVDVQLDRSFNFVSSEADEGN